MTSVVHPCSILRRKSGSSDITSPKRNSRLYSPKHMVASNVTELDEIKKVDDEAHISHRSTSPLTPDLPPSPSKKHV